jgi:hypothetical protein
LSTGQPFFHFSFFFSLASFLPTEKSKEATRRTAKHLGCPRPDTMCRHRTSDSCLPMPGWRRPNSNQVILQHSQVSTTPQLPLREPHSTAKLVSRLHPSGQNWWPNRGNNSPLPGSGGTEH